MAHIHSGKSSIGHSLIELPSVDSTNNYARQLAEEGFVREGTVVWAHEQTAGRGQMGTVWVAKKDQNLTFSVMLFPGVAVEKQFLLNKALTLGVCDYMRHHGAPAVVKWPNDILVNKKKLAGLLIENTLSGSNIRYSIAGLGINVNQEDFNSLPNATSLYLCTGKKHIPARALQELCMFLDQRYGQFIRRQYATIDADYLTCLYGLGEPLPFEVDGAVQTGTIRGVDEHGRLLVVFNEKVHNFGVKEITFAL